MIVRLRSHYAIGLLEGPSAIASSVHTPFSSHRPLVRTNRLILFMQESLGNPHLYSIDYADS